MTRQAAPVAGVLLAAGASTRMGTNKLLLQVEGEPLLRRCARTALAAGLAPVVVVLGHEADRAAAALAGLACRLVRNPDHASGQGTSLRAGLAALPAEAGAAVVLLADMPLVAAPMIARLVAGWRAGSAPLVLSDFGGVLAPPALYDRSLFAELDAAGDAPGKAVVARHRAEALLVAQPAEALADLDTPEDLGRLPLSDRRR